MVSILSPPKVALIWMLNLEGLRVFIVSPSYTVYTLRRDWVLAVVVRTTGEVEMN